LSITTRRAVLMHLTWSALSSFWKNSSASKWMLPPGTACIRCCEAKSSVRQCACSDAAQRRSRVARHPASHRSEQVTRGRSFEDFAANWQLQWLVQRAVEIISEASRAIPGELKRDYPEIPWDRVRGIGNVLRHEYRAISDPLIWNVVADELPRLKGAVQSMQLAMRDQG